MKFRVEKKDRPVGRVREGESECESKSHEGAKGYAGMLFVVTHPRNIATDKRSELSTFVTLYVDSRIL